MPEVPLSQGDDVVQGFSCFPDKPLGIGIALGRMDWRLDDPDAVGLDDGIKWQEAGVPVVDDKAAGRLVIGKLHGQVSGLLRHPGEVGVGRTAGDVNPAGAQVDKEQHVKGDQPGSGPDLFGKKVGGPGHVQVRMDKRFPGQALSLGRGRQAVLF